MSDTRYPTRMHEVLGVVTGEVFTVTWNDTKKDFFLDRFGIPEDIEMEDIDGLRYPASGPEVVYMVNHPERITRRPRLTEEAQEKADHIIRLERMRSQKDQWANGKHAHWLETPADHAKDRDALDAAIEALTGKPRLSEEQVVQLKALVTLGYRWLIKDSTDAVFAYTTRPAKQSKWWDCGGANVRIFIDLPPGILTSLVSWSDPEPLDIVATLKAAGVEVE